ncbi:autotransporter-associated beta strand repeat-containing protein [Limnobaculum parvum]|nr:autotransporter-associated beta strand repeat-containing protein [Limnobaculum parvum]
MAPLFINKETGHPEYKLSPLVVSLYRAFPLLVMGLISNVADAACGATGGSVTTPETGNCTISTAGSTLTLDSSFTGLLTYTGNNTALTINSGGSYVYSGGTNTGILISGPTNTSWILTNQGSVTVPSGSGAADLIGLRTSGNYTIINNGSLINSSATGSANTIESSVNNTNVILNNAGTISSVNGETLNLTGTSTYIINNSADATISSASGMALNIAGNNTTIDNYGTISTGNNYAIWNNAGTINITNEVGGTISSTTRTMQLYGTANIINRGLISTAAGGSDWAINSNAAITVRNAGTIQNTSGQGAMFWSGTADTLILEPGSIITGFVDAAGGNDLLALGGETGSDSFNLSLIGNSTQYRRFVLFDKQENSSWTLTNTGTQNWTLSGGLLAIGSGAQLNGNIKNTTNNNVSLQLTGTLNASGNGTTAIQFDGTGQNALIIDSSAVLSGSNTSLVKNNGGTLTVTGQGSYTGLVNVSNSSGILQIGDNGSGTGGSISNNITDSGTVAFNRSDNYAYTGIISGTGALAQSGSGTTTLTNVQTLTGDTTINNGTLQAGIANMIANSSGLLINSGTFDLNGLNQTLKNLNGGTDGAITMGANNSTSLTVNNTASDVYSGTITGTGSLLKQNIGSLTLTGNVNLTGDVSSNIQVTGGSLLINGGNTVEDSSTQITNSSALTVSGAGSTLKSRVTTSVGASGAGILNVSNSGTVLTNTLSGTSSGQVNLDSGILKALASNNAFISGFSTTGLALLNGGGTVDSNGFDIATGNAFSGVGRLTKTGEGTFTLTGANTHSGGTNVSGGVLRLTNAGSIGSSAVSIDSAGTLFVDSPSSGNYQFNNSLTGNGILLVSLLDKTNTFQFGSGTGNLFAGTAQLGNSTFTLSGDNTVALTDATLQLDTGSTVIVDSGTQTIGGVIFNGGTLRFENLPTGVINADTLTLGSGTVAVSPDNIVNSTANILQQDEGADFRLITAGSVTGDVSGLTLTDLSNNPIADTANIQQGGDTVAIGSYAISLGNDASGLYTHYALTELQLLSGFTTTLSNDATTPSGADELHALITGDGDLAINASTSITLNNGGNSYTGNTYINGGTLILGADNVLGAGKSLWYRADNTSVDLNGKTHIVSLLTNNAAISGATLNINGGNLTLRGNTESVFAVGLIGSSGSVTIDNGNGTGLTLTGNNTYTGDMTINSGSSLTIAETGNYAGDITNNSNLIFTNSADLTYGGVISGSGTLEKNSGSTMLTLTGDNTFDGSTLINLGTLQVGSGGSSGSLTGNITNNDALIFNRLDDTTYSGVLSGSGSFTKLGAGSLTLSASGSAQGDITVNAGTLIFSQAGDFDANNLTTSSGTAITLNDNSTLNISGALTQSSGSTLNATLGVNEPVITADTAALDGTLNIAGIDSSITPSSASALANTTTTMIHTTGGITGNFSTINLSGAASEYDYLTIGGFRSSDGYDYDIGYGLTWLAGPALGDGTFTLTNSDDTFDVDVVLADQTGPFTSGWNGKNLTKEGDGTLLLSAVNTYTGATLIDGGTLQIGVENAFATSSRIEIGSGATLDLQHFDQQINNLLGRGHLNLGSAVLTINSVNDTGFIGDITGTGSLIKVGTNNLSLSGINSYSGGTEIQNGILTLYDMHSAGSGEIYNQSALTLTVDTDQTLINQLNGLGSLAKEGAGVVTLTGAGSSQGYINLNEGGLIFDQGDVFNTGYLSLNYNTSVGITANTSLNLSDRLALNNLTIMSVALGNVNPIVTANTATLGGILNITGIDDGITVAKASDLAATQKTIIHTLSSLTDDFLSVSLGGAASSVDYLTISAGVNGLDYNVGFGLTWLAGPAQGNGVFTLSDIADSFDVDMTLADQTGPFTSTWDGKTLTKQGLGLLQLSSVNTYTGSTLINAGTLQTGIANAFATSSDVNIAGNATLDMNGFAQQANNLAGSGHITLGSGVLTVNSSIDTLFSGDINGTGSLIKSGAGQLTLSGVNLYSGNTTISAGTLKATQSGALSSGSIANNGTLELNFSADNSLGNILSGGGSLVKTGTGNASLIGVGSSQGAVNVNEGALTLAQVGGFSATSLTTDTDAITYLGLDSSLNLSGALTQHSGATLDVTLGTINPLITAGSAVLDGVLNVTGLDTTEIPAQASELETARWNIIHTTSGITGDFSSVNLGGASSSVDYLTLAGHIVNGTDYSVGFGLTWLEGAALGNGIFTLADSNDNFNVDVVLADQTGPFTSGWDGKTLTKEGLGTLQLSSVNTYTGSTFINQGTLLTGVANAFASSSDVTVASGATLNLNSLAQQANNLSGTGHILLGTAALTANNSTATTFGGNIDGSGSLIKLGTGTLTLSGTNSYSNGTTIGEGTLKATQGDALGTSDITNNATLELDFASDSIVDNVLSGTGNLVKSGDGKATLTGVSSSQNNVAINAGTLTLSLGSVFSAGDLNTADGAIIDIAEGTTVDLSGALTQSSGAALNVALGSSADPIINADSATLDGILNVTGFTASVPTSASELTNSQYTILHTSAGITGDFSSVNLSGAASTVDYLTLAGKVVNGTDYDIGFGLTWMAGNALGNGTFTLTNLTDSFNVDVVLADQTGLFASNWDGKSLTKEGLGILQLSSANTYTGSTLINAGTLRAGIANAFATSGNVNIASNATLDLNSLAQQANDLGGTGHITLGSGILTTNSLSNTTFSGDISGTGSLIKTGTGILTLSGLSHYSGGTTINAGTLKATQGGVVGSGDIVNNSIFELDFVGNSTLDNVLIGSGNLIKTGGGNATLTGAGSAQGAINVNTGTLTLAQGDTFIASSLNTATGATTAITNDTQLNIGGALIQSDGANLNVVLGTLQPIITANTAALDGTLSISGFTTGAPASASELANTQRTVIHTTGGITGDFSSLDLGGAASSVDYLTLTGKVSGLDYNIGFGLTWEAGEALGDGTFTLANADDLFNVDVVLADQTGTFTSDWDGKSLTKAGLGTLQLSSVNTYTGSTLINAGTLQAGIADAFATSSDVTVASGATLDLNDFDQQANNLTGAGSILLGSAELTANNSANTAFSGVIEGTGSLTKTGTGTLTLSGINTYQGGSSLSSGNLIATQGSALGTGTVDNTALLELNFASDSTLSNVLSGTGSLTKSGTGTATLNGVGSTQGIILVDQGTLNFTQSGAFNGNSLTTADGASTSLAADASLNLSGALTQSASAILNVAIGNVQPAITAESAALSGTLNITGLTTEAPTNASDLTSTEFTVIHTTGTGGITGDFSSLDLGGAASSVDYLILAGRVVNNIDYNIGFGLTWEAGEALGDGTFTLANADDLFNVDVVLADQTGTFTSDWDGKSLTKAGLGTLQLSSVNTYTGSTLINAGTLQAGIADAFATSSDVTVASGATLDLNDFDQQANNLTGAGSILLGSAELTANNSANTAFSGVIEGTGSLTKTGTGTLTLSGINTYQGGSSLSSGNLIATQGSALGTGTVDNTALLELNFASDSTLSNVLSGTGSLTKSGTGTATLNGVGSTQGIILVDQGTLNFTQSGAFNGNSLTTADGASTSLAADASLNLSGALTQSASAILNVAIGNVQPAITAESAALSGTLNITGLTTEAPTNASDLTSTEFTVIHTTGTGGITGDFSSLDLGGAASSVDYLILAGRVVNNIDYNIGFGLTWEAGEALGNGTFTLATDDLFNVDVVLADQTGTFTSGWDGKSLTKAGLGTLQLSSVNTYTGSTLINAGTLQAGIADAFATSSDVTVASGATLDLNDFDQQANNLTGAGSILLGSAELTANNSANTAFSGVIEGTGSLTKTGTGTLTLSGINTYQGGSSLSSGKVIATQGSALGTGTVDNAALLELNFASDSTLSNVLSGTGSLTKSGTGTATLNGVGSTQGIIHVDQGTLNFAQSGAFNGNSLTTADGASTSLAADASLNLSGALTQNASAILNVAIGNVQPAITADSAALGGTLNITGLTTEAPTNASDLTSTEFTVIHTTGTGGITGDFTTVNLDGAASSVDYLILAGRVVNNADYNVGFGLTWEAGSPLGNGTFTLANADDLFNVDVVLADQTGTFTSDWDGKSLTKAGLGTLQLSSVNTYTGSSLINAGTLQAGIADAFATSSDVTVASGATLDLNDFDQQANNLTGAGSILLGSAELTANNSANTAFSGVIEGTGSLTKTGTGTLTLSGINTYQGGSSLSSGNLIATQGSALGTGTVDNTALLELNFASDSTLSNVLSGTGGLTKSGAGTATLNGVGSTQGIIHVDQGTLNFAQSGVFNGNSLTTADGASTSLVADASLNLSGALTQSASAILNVAIGNVQPAITAESAALSGTLNITGLTTEAPTSASALTNTEFTVIHTTGAGGISGDFTTVNLDGAASSVDYLILDGRVVNNADYNVGFGLTWEAGSSLGNGTFTLANADDLFNVDVVLADQTGTFTSGWDGKSLTKAGLGTLQLSSVNTYTGSTLINAGTLQAGIADAFATSSDVTVASGATLDLNNFDQQANNLTGAGSILLGSAELTANSSANTAFSGVIEGTGSLTKTGTGTLTLSGINTYQGGSSLSSGKLIATQGSALGTGTVDNAALLELNFASDSTLSNVLSGTGSLTKSGTGTATLNGVGSTQGIIHVDQGTLNFTQSGVFNGNSLTTADGASTSLAADASLNLSGALTQNASAILNVAVGSVQPVITADSATLGGTLNITGLTTEAPTNASDLTSTEFTVIHTTGTGGITGDFSSLDLGGAASSVDYLILAGRVVNNIDYNIGFGLTWEAGEALGHGTFTLANADDLFNVDVVLADQTGTFTSGWDGKSLTKAGLGTLQLSSVNTYTGSTLINAGTLQAGIADAFATSSDVTVASGATLDLNDFDQQANNLTGAGSILLGSAELTANNSANTAFSGVIEGTGSLTKTGTGTLTLSGINTYQGGSSLSSGNLIATQGSALGTGTVDNAALLELNFASDSTLSNVLSGTGSLTKSGVGTATLNGVGSTQGIINVDQGTLNFAQSGVFNGNSLTTADGASTSLAADASLNLNGALTQSASAILNVAIGNVQPAITAESAALGGTLNITGLTTEAPTNASDLTSTEFTVIHTTGTGGITGDFTTVNLDGAASSVDYLILAGRVVNNIDYNVGFGLTWQAGEALGNGTFTLATDDLFNVDVVLADQTGTFTSDWDGKSLTKAGLGTLQLSSVNTYTGSTLINAGTLQAGIADAFATSSDVTVASGATLDLNDFDQQANNLTGAGSILLGSAELTANNSANTAFSGVIEGTGSLTKTGTGTLTLSGINTYQGGSSLSSGKLIATQGSALGTGTVDNAALLELNFASDSTLSNVLSGTGSLTKSGTGTATLNGVGSTQGIIHVDQGTLNFTQSGAFNGNSLTTADGASTSLAADASLNLSGALTQNASAILNVAIGNVQPVITADSAALGGTLNITGLTTEAPTNASDLTSTEFTVIHTTGTGGITGDFTTVNLDGAASSVDYLILAGRVVNNADYNVGFGLTWEAGSPLGNGTFTLANAGDLFNVDVVLADQTGTFTSGWDGKSLTKAGLGTLQLSSVNTYTGSTLINAGTLQAGIADAFATSSDVSIADSGTLDLNGFAQQANNLSGTGHISLGSAALTTNNTANTTFSGDINGTGSLIKTGAGVLTLSGVSTYSGGSTISAGTLKATQGGSLGVGNVTNNSVLQLDFVNNSTLANRLTGSGELVKAGSGNATLSGLGSSQGIVNVDGGTLTLAQGDTFVASSLNTASGATTAIANDTRLNISGALTQNDGATLNVALGTTPPTITASTAVLDGTLNISGFTESAPTNASELINTQFTIIHTTGGITGDFSNVNLGGATNSADYLQLASHVVNGLDYNVGFGLTWEAGDTLGNGTFTLTNISDSFNVDVVLADQTGTFTSGWDGKSLTKAGLGTLQLSSVNTYTGSTLINAGTLQAGIADAFATSSDVTVASGATLDLNDFDQQANNLTGAGSILLGSAELTANSSANTAFSGVIEGTGSLTKTGTGTLTLSGINTYQGGSSLSSGNLIATQGSALGTGTVDNAALLELNFASDSTLSNVLSGTGSLTKSGAGTATLNGVGSTQGIIHVDQGTLNFAQSGAFNGNSLTTADGASTSLAADASLNLSGALTQNASAILNVAIGNVQPVITADSAALGGTLNITGFTTGAPTSASALTNTEFTVIHTTGAGGISGDFTTVNLDGAASSVDYLILAGRVVNNADYNVGFGLTWEAGSSLGNGTFTLANTDDLFNVDVVLADQTGTFTSGWDGKSLTKAGLGTLQFSSVNTYTGSTLINAGTLQAGIADAFATSSDVSIADSGTLDLNGFAQQANNLSGTGHISLGSAALTTNNTANTTFSGDINGTGSLIKTGAGVLTLSGVSTYSGGSTISAGTLDITQAGALGTGNVTNNSVLQLDFANDSTLTNVLSGSGNLVKSGAGNAILNAVGSSQGTVNINAGTLTLAQGGAFNASSLTTAGGSAIELATDATLNLSGVLTQQSDAMLGVRLGSVEPLITASAAALGGTLKVVGIDTSAIPDKASEIPSGLFTIIHTTGGITGDFDSVDLNGASSSADYLIVNAAKSLNNNDYNVGFGLTWLAGADMGNGTFTLVNQDDTFNVDIALANGAASATGWDGKSLTKEGAGTLILSAANLYTGNTVVNNGLLRTDIADAFANSANVVIGNNGTLNLNSFDQQINNLTGNGNIVLGNAVLTANSNASSTFDGAISGHGSLIKAGSEALTLSGMNFYSGGTTITQGRLIGTQGNALGVNGIVNNAELELAFAQNGILNNQLTGSGNLIKSGSGIAILAHNNSSQGNVSVNQGVLHLTQEGVFSAANYDSAVGATTSLATNATLDVSNQFNINGVLDVVARGNPPLITADSANIGSVAVINVAGYSAPETTTASQLANSLFTIIQTSAPGNLTGHFASGTAGGAVSPVDYLSITSINDGNKFDVGLALSWYAAHTGLPAKAIGDFTLTGQNEYFDLDALLMDEVANPASGWDGKSLTKAGAGTLELSKANLYTGATLINGGTLLAGHSDIIAQSSQLIIGEGASFDLNSFDQHVNNLTGSGHVVLGDAQLIANNSVDSTFSGAIDGFGSLSKTGSGTLTLTNDNTFTGSTTINEGTLQLGNGGTTGRVAGALVTNAQLTFNHSDNYAYGGVISGNGMLTQQGTGQLSFNQNQTYSGATNVNAGSLVLMNEALLATSSVSVAEGAILGGYGGVAGDVINHGLLAVADALPGMSDSPTGVFTVGGQLVNSGELRMASLLPASQLVVKGNYVGNNGLLTLSTVLGDDNSATDKLVVQGDTSGSTRVVVNNSGGNGAATVNGIEIIHVGGQSNGQFALANRVVAGAYEYSLNQGLPTQADGNWYLRSVSDEGDDTPQWRPESGAYLGNQSMAALMQIHTLFDRQGAQYTQNDGSSWGRIIGGHTESKAASGHVDMNGDYSLVQFGTDIAAYQRDNQRLQIGLMGSWGNADTDATGNSDLNGIHHSATGSVNGFNLGAYATWFADVQRQSGAYVDSWTQYGWYDNEVKGEGQRSDSYDSHLWSSSLEIGYSLMLNPQNEKHLLRLTPQAQVIYSRYTADTFTDSSNTAVSGQNNETYSTRLGLRLSDDILDDAYAVQPYAELNWWHHNQNSAVTLDSMHIEENIPKDRGELKLGLQGNFSQRWQGWINVSATDDFDHYQKLEGAVGVRYVW